MAHFLLLNGDENKGRKNVITLLGVAKAWEGLRGQGESWERLQEGARRTRGRKNRYNYTG